jgi:hypothetical protein
MCHGVRDGQVEATLIMITGNLISIQWIREVSELIIVHEVPVLDKVDDWLTVHHSKTFLSPT